VPALLTLHDLRWSEPREVTGAPFSKWLPRHAAARVWLPGLARAIAGIVTVSPASARAIERRLRVPPERIHVVANASAVEVAPRLERDAETTLLARLGVGETPFLLAVGHLEPRKGLDLALEALASARGDATLAKAVLVLVGSGPGETALRERARALGLEPRVRFAGPLDERATSSLYANAAALVFPSRCEGFGFPVHEARALGCPVVARRLDVLADSLDPQIRLLDGDPRAWADELAHQVRRRMTGESRTPHEMRGRGQWTWSDAAGKLADVYRGLAREGAAVR
jgi:glycosyltransferase involved in cell wall biosynthesis